MLDSVRPDSDGGDDDAGGVRVSARSREVRVATDRFLTKAEQVSDDGGAPPDNAETDRAAPWPVASDSSSGGISHRPRYATQRWLRLLAVAVG